VLASPGRIGDHGSVRRSSLRRVRNKVLHPASEFYCGPLETDAQGSG
jgi:hypothetical protein